MLFDFSKHPTPMAIQQNLQCLLRVSQILKNWIFSIFNYDCYAIFGYYSSPINRFRAAIMRSCLAEGALMPFSAMSK